MKRILVCLDGSYRANAVLRQASEFALEIQARLVLMRAVELPEGSPVEVSLSKDDVRRLLEARATKELEAFARDLPSELNGGIRIEVGDPWQAICRAAKEENVDFIFLGTHGNDAEDRLLGTTVSKVANNADRPVIIFREIPVVRKPAVSEEKKADYESF